jgi:cytochrome c-type biogenesis protein CcmH
MRRLRLALSVALLGLAAWAGAQSAGAQTPAPSEASAAPPVADVVGQPRGPKLAGTALDEETKRVASLLRCPVCQGLSIADSPASMAINMREQVREMLAAGYVEEQILVYFERSYGEFVRLEPPLRGVNWTLWLAPALGLLVGAVVVTWALRSPRTSTPPVEPMTTAPAAGAASAVSAPPTATADPLPEDPALAACVLRVRELAYGWPGGVRPGKHA